MSFSSPRYVHNKDCSEYVEDFVAAQGGSLASIMFINTREPRQSLASFNHPFNLGGVSRVETYIYHTVAIEKFTTIDVTNNVLCLPLSQLMTNIRNHNPHLYSPGVMAVVIPDYIPPVNITGKGIPIHKSIYKE